MLASVRGESYRAVAGDMKVILKTYGFQRLVDFLVDPSIRFLRTMLEMRRRGMCRCQEGNERLLQELQILHQRVKSAEALPG